MIRRRDFLAGSAAVGAVSAVAAPTFAAAETGWNAGLVAHLLPTVSHNRMLLKASFNEPLRASPVLHVEGRRFAGERTDTGGYSGSSVLRPIWNQPGFHVGADRRSRTPAVRRLAADDLPPSTISRSSCACLFLLAPAVMTHSAAGFRYRRACACCGGACRSNPTPSLPMAITSIGTSGPAAPPGPRVP